MTAYMLYYFPFGEEGWENKYLFKNCKFRRSVSFLTAFDIKVKVLLQGSLFQNEQNENLVTKMVLITCLPYTGLVIYTEQNAPHTEIC